jgi:hypothetical protein
VSTIWTDVDAWVLAGVLAAILLAGWAVGRWLSQRLPKEQREAPPSKFGDASLALLGLLLGFTFSMALAKHDQRRQMVVTDSNAIGDFYTCASLLNEPARGQLQAVLRAYVEQRLELARGHMPAAEFDQRLATIQQMQDRMQTLVGQAVNEGTPVVVPLVNTLNEVTSSHASRLAAVRDRLPSSIVLLLFMAAVLSLGLVGAQQGASGEQHPVPTVCFIALVCLVIWVTLDLNQPYRGAITVSQEPLQRLLAGMGK